MRVCPYCYNLVADEEERCLFCHRRLDKDAPLIRRLPGQIRSFPRIKINIPVRFQSLERAPLGNNLDLSGTAKDISAAGIYFETESRTNFHQGSIVWLSFCLEKGRPVLKIQGEVRRIVNTIEGRKGFGLMFLHLDSKVKYSIDKFMHQALHSAKSVRHKLKKVKK